MSDDTGAAPTTGVDSTSGGDAGATPAPAGDQTETFHVQSDNPFPEPSAKDVADAVKKLGEDKKAAKGQAPADDAEPDEPAAEDAPEPEAEPEPTDDQDDGEAAPVEFETDDEAEEWVQRAIAAGMPDYRILAAYDNGRLKQSVEFAEQHNPFRAPEVGNIPELEIPDEITDEYGESLTGWLKQAIGAHTKAVLSAQLAPVQEELNRYRERAALRAAEEQDRATEKFFLDNREKFGDKYGGPVDELDVGSPQLRSRREVVSKAEVLEAGYRASGMQVPAWTKLLEEAAILHAQSSTPAPTNDKPKRLTGRSASRPNATNKVPPMTPEQRAIERTAARLRAKGLGD